MTVDLELVTDIAAPPERCFDLALDVDVHVGSMAKTGERAVEGVTSGRIGLGETVTWRAQHFGIPWKMTSKITALERPSRFVDEQVRGPFSRFRHEHVFEATSAGTRMVDRISFDAPGGPIGDLVERMILGRYLRRLTETRNDFLRSRAEGRVAGATRPFHTPAAERLLAHLREHYGTDAVAATKASRHNDHVFRVARRDEAPWIARVFPPARARAGVEGDAAILRFLERQGFPAERLAVDDAVSELDGSSVLVTRFVSGGPLPQSSAKLGMMGDLLGRLHALAPDDAVSRPGGASGEDPSHEGSPRQDLMAALSFLDAVDTKVSTAQRERFEQLRDRVRSADDGHGLPEALLHGNLLHDPDHALLTDQGPVAINWKSAGRGPRLADFAYLMWGAPFVGDDGIGAAVNAYRRHVELTDDELDRLEAVMYVRPLYLVCFDYRRSFANGNQPTGSEGWWKLVDAEHIRATAAATRIALRR